MNRESGSPALKVSSSSLALPCDGSGIAATKSKTPIRRRAHFIEPIVGFMNTRSFYLSRPSNLARITIEVPPWYHLILDYSTYNCDSNQITIYLIYLYFIHILHFFSIKNIIKKIIIIMFFYTYFYTLTSDF
jgi:hypothetical protein